MTLRVEDWDIIEWHFDYIWSHPAEWESMVAQARDIRRRQEWGLRGWNDSFFPAWESTRLRLERKLGHAIYA